MDRSPRFWISLSLALILFALGIFFLRGWPAVLIDADPFVTPFFGEAGVNTFLLHYSPTYQVQGQQYAYRAAMLVLVLACLFFIAFPGSTTKVQAFAGRFARVESAIFRPRLVSLYLALVLAILVAKSFLLAWLGVFPFPEEIALGLLVAPIFVFRLLPRKKCPVSLRRACDNLFGRIGCLAVCGALLLSLLPALLKVADLAAAHGPTLADINIHFTGVLGHGDRLAAGDVLFRDTTPLYTLTFAVLLGAVEKHTGLLDAGTMIRLLILFEILYFSIVVFLYGAWVRGRWWLGVAPLLLLVPFYCSFGSAPLAPNHNPVRFFGMPLGILGLWLLRDVKPVLAWLVSGFLAAVAILWNPETGIATSAGLVVFHVLRFGAAANGLHFFRLAKIGLGLTMGFAAGLTLFIALSFSPAGPFPLDAALARFGNYLRAAQYGWAYQGEFWPLVVFFHAALILLITVQRRRCGFRDSFRAANCTIILVWFAYFVNRPQLPDYLASFYFPYGFLVLDASRNVWMLARRSRRASWNMESVLTLLVLTIVFPRAVEGVRWSWNPLLWTVPSQRWSAPLLSPVDKSAALLVSGVYLPVDYAEDLLAKGEFLRDKARTGRPIYFTLQSYLMPRVSSVVAFQEFTDPLEAVDRASYDRLVQAVRDSAQTELLFEAVDEAKVVPYGGIFRLLRRELSRDFELLRVEQGWEVWQRKEK